MSNLNRNLKTDLQRGFRDFAESLNEVLIDATTLEVNTILAEDIKGYKFIPEQAYQNIYFCLNAQGQIPNYLHKLLKEDMERWGKMVNWSFDKAHESRLPPGFRRNCSRQELQELIADKSPETYDLEKPMEFEHQVGHRNWRLRERLTQEYCQIFFDQIYTKEEREQHPDSFSANLPYPYSLEPPWEAKDLCFSPKAQELFRNPRFLRSLRKISELQAANNRGDKIYAQTVIQLDGDVINRYRREVFDSQQQSPDLTLLREVHTQGVTAGEEQWRGLLEFCINIIRTFISSQRDRF